MTWGVLAGAVVLGIAALALLIVRESAAAREDARRIEAYWEKRAREAGEGEKR